jgi:predicted RNA-binding protein YlqC (UPF0109 family)
MPETASKLLIRAPFDVISHTGALLTDIVRRVVDQPNRVSLTTLAEGESTHFVITVTARDFARILGIRGRTLQSLRTLLDAIGKRNGQRLLIDIEAEQLIH